MEQYLHKPLNEIGQTADIAITVDQPVVRDSSESRRHGKMKRATEEDVQTEALPLLLNTSVWEVAD